MLVSSGTGGTWSTSTLIVAQVLLMVIQRSQSEDKLGRAYNNWHTSYLEYHGSQDWSYDKKRGPEEWAKHFSECGGQHQSPVAIRHSCTVEMHGPHLHWINYGETPGLINITNVGHTVMLEGRWCPSKRPKLRIGSKVFAFHNIHFHWGPTNVNGSEHTINSKRYAMEMHIVHVFEKSEEEEPPKHRHKKHDNHKGKSRRNKKLHNDNKRSGREFKSDHEVEKLSPAINNNLRHITNPDKIREENRFYESRSDTDTSTVVDNRSCRAETGNNKVKDIYYKTEPQTDISKSFSKENHNCERESDTINHNELLSNYYRSNTQPQTSTYSGNDDKFNMADRFKENSICHDMTPESNVKLVYKEQPLASKPNGVHVEAGGENTNEAGDKQMVYKTNATDFEKKTLYSGSNLDINLSKNVDHKTDRLKIGPEGIDKIGISNVIPTSVNTNNKYGYTDIHNESDLEKLAVKQMHNSNPTEMDEHKLYPETSREIEARNQVQNGEIRNIKQAGHNEDTLLGEMRPQEQPRILTAMEKPRIQTNRSEANQTGKNPTDMDETVLCSETIKEIQPKSKVENDEIRNINQLANSEDTRHFKMRPQPQSRMTNRIEKSRSQIDRTQVKDTAIDTTEMDATGLYLETIRQIEARSRVRNEEFKNIKPPENSEDRIRCEKQPQQQSRVLTGIEKSRFRTDQSKAKDTAINPTEIDATGVYSKSMRQIESRSQDRKEEMRNLKLKSEATIPCEIRPQQPPRMLNSMGKFPFQADRTGGQETGITDPQTRVKESRKLIRNENREHFSIVVTPSSETNDYLTISKENGLDSTDTLQTNYRSELEMSYRSQQPAQIPENVSNNGMERLAHFSQIAQNQTEYSEVKVSLNKKSERYRRKEVYTTEPFPWSNTFNYTDYSTIVGPLIWARQCNYSTQKNLQPEETNEPLIRFALFNKHVSKYYETLSTSETTHERKKERKHKTKQQTESTVSHISDFTTEPLIRFAGFRKPTHVKTTEELKEIPSTIQSLYRNEPNETNLKDAMVELDIATGQTQVQFTTGCPLNTTERSSATALAEFTEETFHGLVKERIEYTTKVSIKFSPMILTMKSAKECSPKSLTTNTTAECSPKLLTTLSTTEENTKVSLKTPTTEYLTSTSTPVTSALPTKKCTEASSELTTKCTTGGPKKVSSQLTTLTEAKVVTEVSETQTAQCITEQCTTQVSNELTLTETIKLTDVSPVLSTTERTKKRNTECKIDESNKTTKCTTETTKTSTLSTQHSSTNSAADIPDSEVDARLESPKHDLIIIVVLFNVRDDPGEHTWLNPFARDISKVKHAGTSITMKPTPLHSLMPIFYDNFYVYSGSLSSPPCTETAVYIVSSQPAYVKQCLLDAFRKVLDHRKRPLKGNLRPIQSLNDRIVRFVRTSNTAADGTPSTSAPPDTTTPQNCQRTEEEKGDGRS